MGCASLIIQDKTTVDIQVVADGKNGIGASAECRAIILSAIATAVNVHPDITVDGIGTDIQFTVGSVNTKPTIAVGLVCRVNIDGEWQYLQLADGNMITIDGQYIKVLRAD